MADRGPYELFVYTAADRAKEGYLSKQSALSTYVVLLM